MRNLRISRQALSLASEFARQPYICRACLAQASRPYHATTPRNAEKPFYERIQSALFGSKESKRTEELREAARQKQFGTAKEEGPKAAIKTRRSDGVVYEIADIVDPTAHADYTVANSWNGLEIVGGEAWVKQRADQGEQYTGFMPQRRAQLTDDDWRALLNNVAAEVSTLQKAGRDVLQVCTNGQSGDYANVKDQLQRAIASGAKEPTSLQLDDARVKLAIMKRTMQLTGRRIPDLAISNAKTLDDLYQAFKTKVPAKKLYNAEELGQLKQTQNVQVLGRRRTVVDREKAVGRWKLIEEELDIRDLPLFGTKYVDAKEKVPNSHMT